MRRPSLKRRMGLRALCHASFPGIRPVPWTSIILASIVVTSVLAQASPAALGALEYDREAVGNGQWWRLMTGHLVHYNWLQVVANVGVFAALSWVARQRGKRVLPVVLLSALLIGAAIHFFADSVMTYRGISGVDCGLFGWLLLTMAVQDRGWKAFVWTVIFAVISARYVIETIIGQSLLPTSLPDGIAVVGIAHVTGLVVGLCLTDYRSITDQACAVGN